MNSVYSCKRCNENVNINYITCPRCGYYENNDDEYIVYNKSMNILNKTKTYLVGHMQYAEGHNWRKYVESELKPLGIKIFNPYEKPFVKDMDEGDLVREDCKSLIQQERYDEVSEKFKQIRIYDLNLVDRSDFIIAHIIPNVASWGSAEEIVTANRAKKPIFLSIEGGKKQCPLWLFGTIPHRYIYNNLEEIIDTIKQIDSGEKPIDSDRWRLLREEYR